MAHHGSNRFESELAATFAQPRLTPVQAREIAALLVKNADAAEASTQAKD